MKPSAGVRATRSSSSRRPRWAAIAKRPYSTKRAGVDEVGEVLAGGAAAGRRGGARPPRAAPRPRSAPGGQDLGQVLALAASAPRFTARFPSPHRMFRPGKELRPARRTAMAELATYELEGRIATIAMDDGKVNALSIEMLKAVLGCPRPGRGGRGGRRPHRPREVLLGRLRPQGLLRAPPRDRRDADAGRAALRAAALLPDPGAGRLQRPRDRRRHLRRRSPPTCGSASRAPSSSASTRSRSGSPCRSTWSSSPASGSPRPTSTARW